MTDIEKIIVNKNLFSVFQPIIDLHNPKVIGLEGLIRGPVDSQFHKPLSLFESARKSNLVQEFECIAKQVVLDGFSKIKFEGKLFLNVSLDVLLHQDFETNETLAFVKAHGLKPNQVVIEITESVPASDYQLLREAAECYKSTGFEIAIDDLGEGFSGLRLWSELRPNYVKIDKHFIQNIHIDAVKFQFVKSIQEIAEKSGALVIAEGIETYVEMEAVRNLGIAYAQGYYIARPLALPLLSVSKSISDALARKTLARDNLLQNRATVERLLKYVMPVEPACQNEKVFKIFEEDQSLYSIPVVSNGIPLGMISRYTMIDGFARPFRRELYGRRSCEMMMDTSAIVVDKNVSLQNLNATILESEPHHLSLGFIITDNGQYIGIGSGQDLLRLVTYMQLNAARYANPLTLLPGNVPILERIESLLESKIDFAACYCDLDNFKPFNDVYGYHKGDEVIQATAKLLAEICEHDDFLGHIGGDDFILLMPTPNWEVRCKQLLSRIDSVFMSFYSASDIERGGIETEDRQGQRQFHPYLSLSIGAVVVTNGSFDSHHEVSSTVAIAKKQAKKMNGNSLFVERRQTKMLA